VSVFPDHFSSAAAGYAAYRPTYPAPLFTWLAERAPSRACAWDCAAGNGQAALGLAPHFDLVVATDASAAQVAHAEPRPGVAWAVMRAEAVGLRDASVSLVCVAQALHWLDRPRFYAEALRVLQPGGILAAWRYGLATIDADIDAVIGRFYRETVGPYWPPERAIVDAGYGTLDFPVTDMIPPAFEMEASWTLAQLGGYLRTWSAVTRYRLAHRQDPVTPLLDALRPLWGVPRRTRRVRWPLEVRAGRVPALAAAPREAPARS
jgi:SAM-dependent methyltransferase